jgi:cellulose biosynthesis protein BcsQ
MAKRLVFFNHKGGVSKTTSAYNVAWMMAQSHKVLLVDGDPQCNLSALILRDDFDQYYIDSVTREQNIKDGVAPAFSGRPVPIRAVECRTASRAKNLYLLAGHANLSEYDAALTFAQTSNNALTTLQNLPGAFAALLSLTEQKYGIEYTLIDLNPGMSAINQNLFLISDAFIVPTNPDPFSIMALTTLETVLPRWVSWKSAAVSLFAGAAYPLPAGSPKFVGTLIQRFNIRNGRAAKPYRENIGEIQLKVRREFVPSLRPSGMTLTESQYGADFVRGGYCLSEIPDFQGLLPKAHDAGVPVFAIRDNEIREAGNVLTGMKEKRTMFHGQFEELSETIEQKLAYA